MPTGSCNSPAQSLQTGHLEILGNSDRTAAAREHVQHRPQERRPGALIPRHRGRDQDRNQLPVWTDLFELGKHATDLSKPDVR